MRKLLILPLLVLLTGCVSYYYPETALEDGVYYAEDDPSYVVYADAYSGVAYYPWYSLDYFYMGYYPYPGFSVGYGYPGGFSIGFGYAFSPWYYPSHYYGYYSPWYGSYYHHHYYTYHPAWRPYRGYHGYGHGGHHGKKKHDRDDRRDRYAGRDRGDRYDEPYGYKRDSGRIDDEYRDERTSRPGGGGEQLAYGRSSTVRRYVSTTPGGQDGNRGMVIRNRGAAKVGGSRLDVDKQAETGAVKAGPDKTGMVLPNYSARSPTGDVRYRSNAKQTKSRTGPVSSTPSSRNLVVKAAPAKNAGGASGNGGKSAARGNTSQKAVTRAPSPSKTSSSSRPKASASSKSSSRVSHSSSKRESSRRNNRK